MFIEDSPFNDARSVGSEISSLLSTLLSFGARMP